MVLKCESTNFFMIFLGLIHPRGQLLSTRLQAASARWQMVCPFQETRSHSTCEEGIHCESLRRQMTGKPDAGDPHVRFDEGEGNPSLLYRLHRRIASPRKLMPILHSREVYILKSEPFRVSLAHFFVALSGNMPFCADGAPHTLPIR